MKLLAKMQLPHKKGLRDGSIVLYHNPADRVTPWVTWWEADEGDRCYGHYHNDREKAYKDFVERCQMKMDVDIIPEAYVPF